MCFFCCVWWLSFQSSWVENVTYPLQFLCPTGAIFHSHKLKIYICLNYIVMQNEVILPIKKSQKARGVPQRQRQQGRKRQLGRGWRSARGRARWGSWGEASAPDRSSWGTTWGKFHGNFQAEIGVNFLHVEQHEQTDAGPDAKDIIGDEEGEVGDGDVEEGRDEGGDDGALHPPCQV